MSRKLKYIILTAISFTLGLQSCKETVTENKSLTQEIEFSNDGSLKVFSNDSETEISTFNIETAIGNYETETGLMHRKSMPKDYGMLFIFDKVQPRSFYMKNTIIELDIIYLDEDKNIVKIYHNAKPFDPTSLPSEAPIKYVLEVNGGIATSLNIKVGDRTEWVLKQ
ncbi:DUF192 domain-containing protein [Patiriisocius marinus]|uniref:DUF192 domain-containing protein n=1 Tax=Patiriisocius marinus TaxID=1397112 RepID=A0A5J4IS92_9FLAO|nr:DUF192 domain-containing protein [Patiriisocius marinus]GER60819.1 hypothetical protein ULMA_29270 [Patiriisocius marinus]